MSSIPYQFPPFNLDLELTQAQIDEYVHNFFPTVSYLRFNNTTTDFIDQFHDEVDHDNRKFQTAFDLQCYIELNPSQKNLTRYGLDEPREILLRAATKTLLQVGLATLEEVDDPLSEVTFLVHEGDRFVFDGTTYEVLSWHRDQYWGNSNRPLWIVVTANRVRQYTPDVETG